MNVILSRKSSALRHIGCKNGITSASATIINNNNNYMTIYSNIFMCNIAKSYHYGQKYIVPYFLLTQISNNNNNNIQRNLLLSVNKYRNSYSRNYCLNSIYTKSRTTNCPTSTTTTSILLGHFFNKFDVSSSLKTINTKVTDKNINTKVIKLKKSHLKMTNKGILLKLIASSVTIANRSGNIIREVMSAGNLKIVDKGINDLQTEADRRVQRCILASLHHKFPNLTVIGEEEETLEGSEWIEEGENEEVYQQEGNFPPELLSTDLKDLCVWVDPLDGTNEYTKGNLDHVTVLIGIAVNGKPIAGIIHQPYYNDGFCYDGDGGHSTCEDLNLGNHDGPSVPLTLKVGRTIWGVVGLGAFGLSRQQPPSDSRRIVTTRAHETELVKMAVDACEATDIIRIGGAGFKVLYLIEGKAHAYIFANSGCKKWDTCAPEAVLRSVGGVLTDVSGVPINYGPNENPTNAGGIVATICEESHKWYIERIPDAVKVGLTV